MSPAGAGVLLSGTIVSQPFETLIPRRLDRLPWSGFHWLVVIALGITWTLDGLEVTLSGAVSGVLQDPKVMGFSPAEIGSIASAYLVGAVLGSLLFGYSDGSMGPQEAFLSDARGSICWGRC